MKDDSNCRAAVLAFVVLIIIGLVLFGGCAVLIERALATTTFNSPIQPPCPPDWTLEACNAAWEAIPPCDPITCPYGTVGIFIVAYSEDGLTCWVTDQTYITNTWGLPQPSTVPWHVWKVFLPVCSRP